MSSVQNSIAVRHNIEVAHRLYESPGKCENIHGHSMWVKLTMWGDVDSTGKLCGLDFGEVKRAFRGYLDAFYDHHLLLNERDPWAKKVFGEQSDSGAYLPGLTSLTVDPTTENLAYTFRQWAMITFGDGNYSGGITKFEVEVQETHVNFATSVEVR